MYDAQTPLGKVDNLGGRMRVRRAVTVVALLTSALAWAQAPSFTASGFVNSASFVGQNPPAVARGELVTLFGENLSQGTAFVPLGPPNPTQLPGNSTRVFFDNVAAPLLYVSPTLVNVQVPFELPQGLSTVDVRVQTSQGVSSNVSLKVVGQDPGVFAVLNADGSGVAPGRSAPGDVLSILADGLGDTIPTLASGTPA